MRKACLFLSVSACVAASASAGWRTYQQTVEVTFDTPEAAAQAQLAALPLPPGKRLAFSSRWDDTNKDHARMIEVLAAHGYKGTFYLNRVDQPYADMVIRKILEKGGSVGSHTVHHPRLPELGPNAIFKEILANRIAVETLGQTCVNAFTLPYCAYTSTNNAAMPRIIGDCLRRSGLLGGPEYWPDAAAKYGCGPQEWVGAFTFSINDRDPQLDLFEKALKKGLEGVARNTFECGPHLVLGIHTWQKDDRGFGKFGEIIATAEKRSDWWYCNENEYVAYRMQLFHSAVAKKGVSGKTATFAVERVVPFELGDRVALGLQVTPAPRGVALGGQPLALSGAGEFLMPHDAAQRLPARVAAFHNADNQGGAEELVSAQAVPGVRLALCASTEKSRLSCLLKNASGADVKDVRLTFRMPPRWKTGVVARDIPALKAGAEQRCEIDLGERQNGAGTDNGPLYFAVQADLTDAQGAARVYGTTEVGTAGAAK